MDITCAPFYTKHFQFDIYDGQTPNRQDTHSDGSVVLIDDLVHVEGPSAELCVLGGSLDGGQVRRPHVFGGIHPEPSHPEVDQVIVVANDHLPDVILTLKKIINKQRELSSPTCHCCWTSKRGRLPACLCHRRGPHRGLTHLVQVGQTQQVAVADVVGVAVIVDVAVAGGALAPGVEVGGGVRNTGKAEGRPVKLGSSRSVPTVLRPRHVVDDGVHEDPEKRFVRLSLSAVPHKLIIVPVHHILSLCGGWGWRRGGRG